jgi:SulP family sulfate permease
MNVPDSLASAAMAGVNPVYGLYTCMSAPIVGGLLTSTQLMMVATTSASAIAAAQAIASYDTNSREQALFLLVILIGVFQVLAGLLRLGRLTRFVSHSVMTGFLTGVATLLILDQLAPFVGYAPQGANEIAQFWDLLRHVADFVPPTMVVGAMALILAIVLGRSRVGSLGALFALVIPAIIVSVLGWDGVEVVADTSPIPRGIPLPTLPALELLSPSLIVSALAISIIILVQGAGVSQSFPNLDGSPSDPSRDFLAQGAANVATGFFKGIPAGGSVGQTALNVSLDAQSRLSVILAGVCMLLIVLLIPGLVGKAPMAALAALMIMAGVSAIDLPAAQSIWKTGWLSRLTMLVTFVATLFLSIPAAVGIGVLLSMLLFVSSSSTDVRVYELVQQPNGTFREASPPEQLPSRQVIVLDIVGSLFFAGARTLEQRLPAVANAESPVVVLRLRGHVRVGATFLSVIDKYSDQLAAAGGRLYLSGVDEVVYGQIQRSHQLDLSGPVNVFTASEMRGESSHQAYADAMAWTIRRNDKNTPGKGSDVKQEVADGTV